MSPVSRKRKKPARRRPDPTLDAVAAEVVASYGETLEAGGFDVELYTSELLGTWWLQAVTDGTNPEAVPRAVVRYAAHRRTTEALGALLALAHLGTSAALREAARDAATRLADANVTAPEWAGQLGPVAIERCAVVTDVYGEQTTALFAFERNGRRHGMLALIDHDELDGEVDDAWFSADPDGLFEEVAEQVADSRGLASLDEADPGEVADLVRAGFALLDESEAPPEGDELPVFRALALTRLRHLPRSTQPEAAGTPPDGSPAEPTAADAAPDGSSAAPGRTRLTGGTDAGEGEVGVDAAVAGFLDSPHAAGPRDDGHGTPAVTAAARAIAEFGAGEDGRPLRIGPGRLGRMLHGGIPAEDLDEDGRAAFPAVAVAWSRYAAGLAGLPDAAVTELSDIATECAGHIGDDHDAVEFADDHLARLTELSDLSEDELAELVDRYVPELDEDSDGADPDEVAEILERRLFAVPETVIEIDGEDAELNPADPDERRMLIVAEHAGDQDSDEIDPHVTMHEVVAEQLWRNQPPEAWQAARRLLDTGAERMDILHALGEVALRQIHAALTGTPHDPAQHAADLNALGR